MMWLAVLSHRHSVSMEPSLRDLRYALRDPDIFRWVMDHPGCGVPYSVRTLADASGCKPGLIGALLTGRQKSAGMGDAHKITEALGVAVLVLFAPPSSPQRDESSTNHGQKE
jgi:hypothetical protein